MTDNQEWQDASTGKVVVMVPKAEYERLQNMTTTETDEGLRYFWKEPFEMTIASGDGDKTGVLHILIFRDPLEVDSWDVANCGQSLGDWKPHDLGDTVTVDSTLLCKPCFTQGLRG